MPKLFIEQIPVLQDNFVYLLHDEGSGKTAVVDPSVPEPVLRRLAFHGWKLDYILNTHHHPDHVGGNLALQRETNCTIVGARVDQARIPGIQVQLDEGDAFVLGESEAKVLFVPGHTRGHIAYWFESAKALFSGDVIFSLGSGFLFEGTAEQMWASIEKIKKLPTDTLVYGAHEYTLDNANYAITLETRNPALLAMVARAEERRAKNLSTVPTTIAEERAANPFLRAESVEIQKKLGLVGRPLHEVFGAIRKSKDEFDRRESN